MPKFRINKPKQAAATAIKAPFRHETSLVEAIVLGTFAIYHRQPHIPTQRDIDMIIYSAQLASIAIERKQTEEALKALAEFQAHVAKPVDAFKLVQILAKFKPEKPLHS